MTSRIIRIAALCCLVGGVPIPASAQSNDLYAALVRSRGYVVGGALAGSGLHSLTGDTTWRR